jgi:LemA protein
MTIWVLVGILVVVLLALFTMYNSLVGKKNAVENAFAGIDAILKKRYDLIPNLVATVKQYMQHEAGVLTEVTELRSKATSGKLDQDDQVEVDNRIGRALRGIMVQVEAYPELKANENFQQLQRTLNEIEEQLSASRRAFNAAVTDYNNAIEMFPTNMMAGMMGYKRRRLFEIPEAERENPNVGNLFGS